MTIQPIGPTTSLLYLTSAELQERDIHPEFLTHDHALELAREGFSSLGLHMDDTVKLEIFPDKNGLLLFVHTAPPAQSVWRFMDCDAFLDAVLSMPDIITADLYWWKEAFWLVSADGSDLFLSEFADLIDGDPLLSARLVEYAAPLMTNNT